MVIGLLALHETLKHGYPWREAEDARDLREEAAKLGYVIRDEETRQYWRAVGPG